MSLNKRLGSSLERDKHQALWMLLNFPTLFKSIPFSSNSHGIQIAMGPFEMLLYLLEPLYAN